MEDRDNGIGWLLLFILMMLIWQARGESSVSAINLEAVATIESGGNPAAINKKEGSYGLFQAREVFIRDFNERTGAKVKPRDLLREEKAAHLAIWAFEVRIPELLRSIKKPITTKNILWTYNCGIGCVDKGRMPETTKKYLAKYRRLTGEKV